MFRLVLGIRLILLGTTALTGEFSGQISFATHLLSIAGAVVLMAGLWTPVVGVLLALDQVSIAVLHYGPQTAQFGIHLFLAILSLGIAMLGPGAWSIDARLFGRKRFDIDPRGRKPSL